MNFRPSSRHFNLVMGCAALLFIIPALILAFTGGVDSRFLGIKLKLFSLKNPSIVSLGIALLATLLYPSSVREWLNQWNKWFQTHPWKGKMVLILPPLILLSCLKMWQFHTFQINAWDLCIQSGVAWNTAHGKWFWEPLQQINYLGDHYSPFYLLLVPLYRLWESAAFLLILQTLGLGIAALALYRLTIKRTKNFLCASVLILFFFINKYINSVNEYDFHPIAFAIPVYLWMLVSIEEKRPLLFLFMSVLSVLIEETLIPPLMGIAIYTASTQPRLRYLSIGILIVSAVVLHLIVNHWMVDALYESRGFIGHTHSARWAYLGNNADEIYQTVIHRPWMLFSGLIHPPTKILAVLGLFASFGFLALLSGHRLLLLAIPILTISSCMTQNMYDYHFHYSGTTIPLIAGCSVYGLEYALQHGRSWPQLSWVRGDFGFRILSIAVFLFAGWNTWYSPSYLHFWDSQKVRDLHSLVQQIPPEAAVSASQSAHFVLPHLSNRRVASMFYRETKREDITDLIFVHRLQDAEIYQPFIQDGILQVHTQCGEYLLLKKSSSHSNPSLP